MTDEQLYQLCKTYGERARMWRQKFAGLLPEVMHRELYKKKGFGSIFEFAAKLAGMSEAQVSRVLSIDEKFRSTPRLKSMLEKGEVSINKLARVTGVISKENEEFWAQQLKVLPQDALETLVRDAKKNQQDIEATSGTTGEPVQTSFSTENSVRAHKSSGYLELSAEVQAKLFELQSKGIDINVLILEFFKKRELEIAQEKEKIAATIGTTDSRYIPAHVRAILKQEHGEKCSISSCTKPAEVIHHTQRFALSKAHDPRYLAPLCKSHHIIAHSIDRVFHRARLRRLHDE